MERVRNVMVFMFVFVMRVWVHRVGDQMEKNVTQKTADSKCEQNLHGFVTTVD